MNHVVFVSYSTNDKKAADNIVNHIEAQGISCWYAPRNILPGAKYHTSIMNALNECLVGVFVISSESLESKFVESELERAFTKGKVLIPFRIENVRLPEDWSFFISTAQWIDAFPPNDEKRVFDSLVSAIQQHMKMHEIGQSSKEGLRIDPNASPIAEAPETTPESFAPEIVQIEKVSLVEETLEEHVPEISKELGSYKGVLFDTNRSWDSPPGYCDSFKWMMENNRVSSFGDRREAVKVLTKGDIVFYSHKWIGIVAAARIVGEKMESNDDGEECYWDVEFLTTKPSDFANPPGMTFKQVKEATGKNFFWARIVKVPYLKQEEAEGFLTQLQNVVGKAST